MIQIDSKKRHPKRNAWQSKPKQMSSPQPVTPIKKDLQMKLLREPNKKNSKKKPPHWQKKSDWQRRLLLKLSRSN